MAFSGIIPMVKVGSNSLVNNFVGGLVNNAVNGAVNVAISPNLDENLRNSLGLPPISPNGFVNTILTPGLVATGSQAITRSLTNAITNSGALSFAGPLVQGLAEAGLNNLTQSLLGSSGLGSNSYPDKYFPGGGKEPEANYAGYAYNTGTNGADVIFSIKPAISLAKSEVNRQVSGNTPAASEVSVPSNAYTPSTNPVSPNPLETAEAFKQVAGNIAEPLGTPELFKSLVTGAEDLMSGNFNFAAGSIEQSPEEDKAWNFICAPQSISWGTSSQVDRVGIFGTNTPPVISGSKGMRDLSISEAMVEGFSRNKSVEAKVSDLEGLMNFSLDTVNGYVKVPVYSVYANNKRYGDVDGGCFVIKEISVKETLRDLSGSTTRAMVDISLTQVPSYQVDDGRDIASKTVASATSPLNAVAKVIESRPVAPATAAAAVPSVSSQASQRSAQVVNVPGIPPSATNVSIDQVRGTATYRLNGARFKVKYP